MDHQEGVGDPPHVLLDAQVDLRERARRGPAHPLAPAQAHPGEAPRAVSDVHLGDLSLPGVGQVEQGGRLPLAAGAHAAGHDAHGAEWHHQVPQQDLHRLWRQVHGQRRAAQHNALESLAERLALLHPQPDVHGDQPAHADPHHEDGQPAQACEHLVGDPRAEVPPRRRGLGRAEQGLDELLPVREDGVPVLHEVSHALAVAVAGDVHAEDGEALRRDSREDAARQGPAVDVPAHAVAVENDGLHVRRLRVHGRQRRPDVQPVS
mmetsp:Transcript_81003/g.249970  ORF Transcript_81003/g.249970 Transcript_81003/m.249970 type:complete len:264 (+) Transcript_81003:588-1379(+)